jgi:hypothetical protein
MYFGEIYQEYGIDDNIKNAILIINQNVEMCQKMKHWLLT